MSEHKNENREASQIYWPDGADGEIRTLKNNEKHQIKFHADKGGHWILETLGGVEMRRHNVKFIETIIWIED